MISVESSYYFRPIRRAACAKIFRVLHEGGSAWVLINYYRDNPHSHQWAEQFAIPAHLLSAEEWAAMFRDAGFTDVAHRRIPDPTPVPETTRAGGSATPRSSAPSGRQARSSSKGRNPAFEPPKHRGHPRTSTLVFYLEGDEGKYL